MLRRSSPCVSPLCLTLSHKGRGDKTKKRRAQMWLKIHIKQFERGLLFRRGDFVRPLGPGTYRIPIWRIGKDRIEVVSTLKTKFEHTLLDVLVRDERLRE